MLSRALPPLRDGFTLGFLRRPHGLHDELVSGVRLGALAKGVGLNRRRITKSPRALIGIALAGFAFVAYGPDLTLPFVGDDFVFVDETMHAPFRSIWSRSNGAFRWYRPWSRECHFWMIQHLAGPSPLAFRLVGLALWFAALALYMRLLGKFMDRRSAWVAVIAAAALAFWGTPLLWISGSQDLWLLVWGLAFLVLVAEGRSVAAVPVLALALLSKETAAILPVVAAAYLSLICRAPWRAILSRTIPFVLVTGLWAWWHPYLYARLAHPLPSDAEALTRPSQSVIAVKNLLASLNLSLIPRPFEVSIADVLRTLLSAALLAVAVLVAIGAESPPRASKVQASRNRSLKFSAVWAAAGWLPTHLPSIAWHAYYGCLGALGIWAGLVLVIPRRLTIVMPIVVALALLRGADAKTLTWDWGNEWYLRRAGLLLQSIEHSMKSLEPSIPPHTRVYFARIPNNIGLVAGQGGAIRVWYGDSTLTADFYSHYRRRPVWMASGSDLFFRFDTLRVLTKIVEGPEDAASASALNEEWPDDHVKLAMLFLEAGEPQRAARQFEKLAQLEAHPEAILFGGVARELAGQQLMADSAYSLYGRRTGASRDSIRKLVEILRRTAPTSSEHD